MTDVIITKAGSYRTVDGRRVEVEMRGSDMAVGTNLECMDSRGRRHAGSTQKYRLDGTIWLKRPGEENDRIVGEWPEVIVGKTYYGSTGEVKVEAVANDWVVYSHSESCTEVCRSEVFLAAYQPERPTKTVWVNLWWNSTAGSIHVGQMHASEAEANRGGDRNGLLATISLKVPA